MRCTHGDFVLPCQVGPLAQQLAFRQGEDAGGLSDEHSVVQLAVARRCWDQVTALGEPSKTNFQHLSRPQTTLAGALNEGGEMPAQKVDNRCLTLRRELERRATKSRWS